MFFLEILRTQFKPTNHSMVDKEINPSPPEMRNDVNTLTPPHKWSITKAFDP